VIVKASARRRRDAGCAIVRSAHEMASSFAQAQQEGRTPLVARTCTSKSSSSPPPHRVSGARRRARDVEILGERDAPSSAAQKLIEESPSPKVTPELRKRISKQLSRPR